MSRDVSHLDEEICQQCESNRPGDIDLINLNSGGEIGEKHTESYECQTCGATGTATYTPPDSSYTLDGELFGE